jgi:hypothetical protein
MVPSNSYYICAQYINKHNYKVKTHENSDQYAPGLAFLKSGISILKIWRLWTSKHLRDLLLQRVASGDGGSYTIFNACHIRSDLEKIEEYFMIPCVRYVCCTILIDSLG